MRYLGILCGFAVLCILLSMSIPAIPATPATPVTSATLSTINTGRFDCILIAYGDGKESDVLKESDRVIKELKNERVITYPDDYVPILVPRRLVTSLKKQLGSQMLILSPHLE